MSQAEEAFALVKERGEMRSSAIAETLGCTAGNVHELLLPWVERGELVACDVEIRGEQLKDYRISVAGGGTGKNWHGPHHRSTAAERKPPTPPRAAAPQPEQPKEESKMSITTDKIVAALKKYGPMTSRQAAQHVDCSWLSVAMSQLADKGVLNRLPGGGPRSTVYALPGQKAPSAGDAPPKARKPKKKKAAGAKPGKRAGGGQARAAQAA